MDTWVENESLKIIDIGLIGRILMVRLLSA